MCSIIMVMYYNTYVFSDTLLDSLPKLVLVSSLQSIKLIQFGLVTSNEVSPSDDLSGQKLLSKFPIILRR